MSAPRGHEPMDVPGRPLLLAAVGLLVVLVAVAAGQLLLLRHYAGRAAEEYPREVPDEARTPPEPRLLVNARSALLELRAEEEALLHGYAWVNREAGIVRIPIERAIEVLASPTGNPPQR